MTDQQWSLAWKIFAAAVDLPPEQRRSLLATCESEPEVLNEVTLMLEEGEGSLLNASRPPAGWRTGSRFGRYEIGPLLNSGGMGEVYVADDPELSRKIAIKFLGPDMAASGSAVEQLMREARAASALNHPHIITVYEMIREADDVAIAMELVEGLALRNFCGKPLPASQLVLWGRQIAQALAAAHHRKIIHRDVKPENLMVRHDGILKVLDFGIAGQPDGHARGTCGQSSGAGGTLTYMSPEQIRGEPLTGASDVFSLGAVFYELATGTHPFRSASPLETLDAIANVEPKPPSSLNGGLPASLDVLLLWMLSKDPLHRPSALEVDHQLALSDSGKLRRHFRVVAWTTAAAIAVLIITAVATPFFHDRFFPTNKEPQLLQLTRQVNENRATSAAVSPDGQTLLFATFPGSIYRRRMSDGFTQALDMPNGLRVDRMAWFQDGSKIVIDGSITGPLDKYEPGIWIIPATTASRAEQVLSGAKNGVPSPDGSQIAFTSVDESRLSVVALATGKQRQIRTGGNTTTFSSLLWSPDGKRIGFQRVEFVPPSNIEAYPSAFLSLNAYQYDYQSVDVESGRLMVSAKSFLMQSACGLKDGSILFLRNNVANPVLYQLWKVRTDTHTGSFLKPPEQLTHGDHYLTQISASLDGREVVSVRGVDGHPNIYLADLPPARESPRFLQVRRLTFTDADDYPHAWTPDNRSVIFESDRNGKFHLFRQDISRGDAQSLANSTELQVLPHVSPDGRWMLYNSGQNQSGPWAVMAIPINGGPAKCLLANQGIQGEFACATGAAGRCVLRTVENHQFVFWDLSVVHGKGRELARTAWMPAVVADWDISPDGSQVAIPNHDPRNATIRLVPLDARAGVAEKNIPIKTLRNLSGVVWAPNGRGWYVAISDTNRGLLFYVDSDGRVLTHLTNSMAATYAVPSPDGRHVAFADWTVSANVWRILLP